MAFDIPALQRAANNPPVQNTDLARYILTHANIDWSKAANLTAIPKKKAGPSVLSRIFDVISRPSYAVDEMARRFFEHETTKRDPNTGEQVPINPQKHSQDFLHEVADILHGGASGLAGTQKTTWAKTFNELNPNAPAAAKYGGGFILDLLTDPTTYLGPGVAKSVIRGARGLITGGKVAEKAIPENKGIVSVVQGMSRVPSPPLGSQRLPEALSRASSQVKIPDFHAPGMVVSPGKSVPKLSIYTDQFGAPTKNIAELASKNTPLTKQEIDAISRGGARTTAQILGRIMREKGHDVNVRALESQLAKSGGNFSEYIKQVKDLGINEAGLKAQKEAKALSLEKLQKGAAKKLPMMNPRTGVNIERAGDIIDKIANGDFERFTKPPVAPLSKASPQAEFWAQRTAKDFEKNVLRKANNFSKKAAVNNPAQQANLFNRFTSTVAPRLINAKNANSAKFMPKRFAEAYRMMKVAEAYYKSVGLSPTFWDGSKVALTDVIDELGGPTKMTKEHMTQLITAFKNRNPDKIINPDVKQAIERVRARDSLESAKWVRLALDQNTQRAAVADQVLSKGKYNEFVKKLIADNSKVMTAADVSPTGVKSAQYLLRDILTRNGTLPEIATNLKKTHIQLYSTPGNKTVKWLPVAQAQTKALSTVLGSNPAQLGKAVDKNGEAEHWFLSRFATWYGNKDLRPAVLEQTAGALNNAAARAHIWNQVAKDYTPDEINEAFKTAQGHILSPSSQKVTDLSMQLQRAMENLFSSTGVSNEAQKGASVALRSGVLIEDLNDQLRLVKTDFRFTSAKDIKDFMGRAHNYSKGVDWLKSWEVYEAKDPLDFIMRIETATEQLMHKYAFLDEVGARWGSKIRSKVFSTPVAGEKRLDGLYFSKDLVPQVDKALRTWHQIYDPKSDLIRFLDKVTRAWKSGVTIYAPSHHIRNFIGDVYLSWLAGVNNPRSYTVAKRVLFSQKDRYKSLETISDLTDKNAIRQTMTKSGDVVLTTRGGVDLTSEQVYIAAHSKGLLSHVNVIEDLIGDPLIKAQPFNGKVKDLVHSVSEIREHYVRLAHFVHVLKKSRGNDLPHIFSEAAQEVRKWHPDGMDLTKFEREKMKRIFPFYSWTRKTIPLMVEGAVTRPGKIIAYPRAMYALQGSLGIPVSSPTEPFPEDQLFPSWIRAKGIGPILGGPGNYTIVNPSNPFNDLVSQYAGNGSPRDTLSGVGSALNPLARIPAELLTGQTVLGKPVDQDLNRYATEQIPIAALLSRLFNMGLAGPTNKAQNSGMLNDSALINFLTALGVQPTKPYIKEAEYEQRGK